MRGVVLLVMVSVTVSVTGLAACERRADVPPGQPTEGVMPDLPAAGAEPGPAPGPPTDSVQVEFVDREGRPVGAGLVVHREDGAEVTVRVSGLTPGAEHGFHVHERGLCGPPDFSSAGGHFNPHGRQHGFQNPAGPHAGDLPNLRANAEGVADTTFLATNVRLRAGAPESLVREGGVALMVHARPDDYRTDPSGESGDRIACAVLRPE